MINTQNTFERHTNLLLMPLVGKSLKNSKTSKQQAVTVYCNIYNHGGACLLLKSHFIYVQQDDKHFRHVF